MLLFSCATAASDETADELTGLLQLVKSHRVAVDQRIGSLAKDVKKLRKQNLKEVKMTDALDYVRTVVVGLNQVELRARTDASVTELKTASIALLILEKDIQAAIKQVVPRVRLATRVFTDFQSTLAKFVRKRDMYIQRMANEEGERLQFKVDKYSELAETLRSPILAAMQKLISVLIEFRALLMVHADKVADRLFQASEAVGLSVLAAVRSGYSSTHQVQALQQLQTTSVSRAEIRNQLAISSVTEFFGSALLAHFNFPILRTLELPRESVKVDFSAPADGPEDLPWVDVRQADSVVPLAVTDTWKFVFVRLDQRAGIIPAICSAPDALARPPPAEMAEVTPVFTPELLPAEIDEQASLSPSSAASEKIDQLVSAHVMASEVLLPSAPSNCATVFEIFSDSAMSECSFLAPTELWMGEDSADLQLDVLPSFQAATPGVGPAILTQLVAKEDLEEFVLVDAVFATSETITMPLPADLFPPALTTSAPAHSVAVAFAPIVPEIHRPASPTPSPRSPPHAQAGCLPGLFSGWFRRRRAQVAPAPAAEADAAIEELQRALAASREALRRHEAEVVNEFRTEDARRRIALEYIREAKERRRQETEEDVNVRVDY